MNANLITKKIEMSKTEAKAAGKIGTDQFKELKQYMEMYPNFEIMVKASTTKKITRDTFKGLTYDYMEQYIAAHDDEEKSIMAEFKNMRGTSDEAKALLAKSASYKEIKEWFLSQYPVFEKFHKKSETAAA